MAEDYYTRELFRQAQAFERLEAAFAIGNPTEKNIAMAQVSKGMAEVCMMLADFHIKEKIKVE